MTDVTDNLKKDLKTEVEEAANSAKAAASNVSKDQKKWENKAKDAEKNAQQNQERQRRNADNFTKTIDGQINQDLESQLKNLNDHLPKHYKQKVKSQDALIKQKGEELTKQGQDQADKIKQMTQDVINSNPNY